MVKFTISLFSIKKIFFNVYRYNNYVFPLVLFRKQFYVMNYYFKEILFSLSSEAHLKKCALSVDVNNNRLLAEKILNLQHHKTINIFKVRYYGVVLFVNYGRDHQRISAVRRASRVFPLERYIQISF